ncbi:hypothetical protein Pth03_53290 [Planotetraspora thailandica]|uniref:DUF4178 domain-containing protein n=1 Tax=Planotetraspora thailandica TaxID=487172 RepID=A0A8J3VES1_9ACTN|nr:DUF4178 domain-containing protein [Planotetraspora thailandica]GII56940.1 hypothetical protein Pth03_53290 [Planotetraspora thailandica]
MTAAVMLALGVALLVVVLCVVVVLVRRRRVAAPPSPSEEPVRVPAPAPGFFDPRTIKVGDVVHIQGVKSRAVGALHLSRQGDLWTEYLLDEGVRRYQWLSVEERRDPDGGDGRHLEVSLWTQVPSQGMVPAKSMLIMEGVEFYPVERGTVAFRSEGDTGHPDRGLLDFAHYRALDGRLLSFERVHGGQWMAFYTRPLTPGSIRVDRIP